MAGQMAGDRENTTGHPRSDRWQAIGEMRSDIRDLEMRSGKMRSDKWWVIIRTGVNAIAPYAATD